jgi:hypothetical protein
MKYNAKSSYSQKLKDPRWQKLRLEVMNANDFSCEVCGDGNSTLNVHHKEYFKGHEPWEYEREQLAVICESCHEELHESIDILKWVCSYSKMDGPRGRFYAALVLAGFLDIDYDGFLSFSCSEDNKYFRELYESGKNAQKY